MCTGKQEIDVLSVLDNITEVIEYLCLEFSAGYLLFQDFKLVNHQDELTTCEQFFYLVQEYIEGMNRVCLKIAYFWYGDGNAFLLHGLGNIIGHTTQKSLY